MMYDRNKSFILLLFLYAQQRDLIGGRSKPQEKLSI